MNEFQSFKNCVADGASNMIGWNKGVIKLLKDDQTKVMPVPIHRKNLAAAILSLKLD